MKKIIIDLTPEQANTLAPLFDAVDTGDAFGVVGEAVRQDDFAYMVFIPVTETDLVRAVHWVISNPEETEA